MCQKAFGNYFAPLAGVPLGDFAWTKGEPGVFRSSELVERGFCHGCGTPLFFRYVVKDRISVSIGSLDEPARVKPVNQDGREPAAGLLRARRPAGRDDRGGYAGGVAAAARLPPAPGPRLKA